MDTVLEKWIVSLGYPSQYDFTRRIRLIKRYNFPECDGELYLQANGPGTFQRVFMVFPKRILGKLPAVAVPFYFPEGMLGFELDSRAPLSRYTGIEMMLHLVRRGFAAASADAFHLTYCQSSLERGDFSRWHEAGQALLHDHPHWTGIGKLTADTKLLVDALAADSRIDEGRIGLAGHSLGGKMAFYAGCLDNRIRAILASDFGLEWDQSNWNDCWYWGEKLKQIQRAEMDHSQLLSIAAPKPFFLIAGCYDNDRSFALMKKAAGYEKHPEHLGFLNHAAGHRPPLSALETGYCFLEKYL